MEQLTFTVDGLRGDPRGQRAVECALASERGVARVFVNALIETVYVAYDPAVTSSTHLAAALTRAGLHPGELRVAPKA
jgi:hypothetical protein